MRGYEVEEQHYKFWLSKSSVEYIVAFFCFAALNSITNIRLIFLNKECINSISSFCGCMRFMTVKVVSPIEESTTSIKKMIESYLFNISYNYGVTLSIDDFSRNKHILNRRSFRDGSVFPYKYYNQELVKYYYQGLVTDLPFTQYLAFYHVVEFFFQTISEEDAFKEIENIITHPGFSPYKKDEIKYFYETIKKKIREQRDDGVWNEKNALLLCLKNFIPKVETLKKSVNAIDSSAIDYYKSTPVEFTNDGKTIDFEDIDSVYNSIRDRVYAVRNAIVHSKEGQKQRYQPFKHDKILTKEIPLIRCIAEEIIIFQARPISFK